MLPGRYSACFMKEPCLDQSSEVTCSSLHSLLGSELILLTPSCGLSFPRLLVLVTLTLTHGIALSETQKLSIQSLLFRSRTLIHVC